MVVCSDGQDGLTTGTRLMFAGSNNDEAIWTGLVEKAYAQLMSQTGVTTYAGVGNIESYFVINGGWGNGLSAITGLNVAMQTVASSTSNSAALSDRAALQAALNSGEGVMLSTSTAHNSNSSIISDHMYSVTAVNAAAGTVTIFNPWGYGTDDGTVMSATVTLTVAQLQQQGVYLYEATGKAAAT